MNLENELKQLNFMYMKLEAENKELNKELKNCKDRVKYFKNENVLKEQTITD